MNIDFSVSNLEHGQAIEKVFEAAESLLKLEHTKLSLSIVSRELIADINEEFGESAEATDVLSFDYREDDTQPELDGEILICEEIAEAQAKEHGINLTDEIALLALHGLLHLNGYDHAHAVGRDDMDAVQKQILEQAGYKYRNFGWKEVE